MLASARKLRHRQTRISFRFRIAHAMIGIAVLAAVFWFVFVYPTASDAERIARNLVASRNPNYPWKETKVTVFWNHDGRSDLGGPTMVSGPCWCVNFRTKGFNAYWIRVDQWGTVISSGRLLIYY